MQSKNLIQRCDMKKDKLIEALDRLVNNGHCDQWITQTPFDLHISVCYKGLETYKLVFTVYHENSSLISDIEMPEQIKEGECLSSYADLIIAKIKESINLEINIFNNALLALGAEE